MLRPFLGEGWLAGTLQREQLSSGEPQPSFCKLHANPLAPAGRRGTCSEKRASLWAGVALGEERPPTVEGSRKQFHESGALSMGSWVLEEDWPLEFSSGKWGYGGDSQVMLLSASL